MIEARGLGKRFGGGRARGTMALADVSLSVPAGECWALAGPNGAGKSTLLGLLLGFLRPSSGKATVDDLPPREYARLRGASTLPERVELAPSWTPRALLRAAAALDGAPAGAPGEALAAWGLEDVADTPWRALSTGTRQRLLLAQALLAPRTLVVLDEPTSGLDPAWRLRLRERLGALRAAGHTMLLASHDLAEVERVADRVVVLEGGRVREVLDVRADAATGTGMWLLELAGDGGQARTVLDVFPDARAGDAAGTYHVAADDEADLSARLAALLAAGGVVRTVRPVEDGLEVRVRRSLEGEA